MDTKMKMIRYSEIFYSLQGEGKRCGTPTVWLRLWNCNLNCHGFGQKDPTNPDTYVLDYEKVDASGVTNIKDLPVFATGCDSSYSWSNKFLHLATKEAPEIVAQKLIDLTPFKTFVHKNQTVDLCFTGGEPLLPANQRSIVAVLDALYSMNKHPQYVTFETNGTRALTEQLEECLSTKGIGVTFSVSPKLFQVSGEKASAAIKPDAVNTYMTYCDWHYGELYFKFVINGTKESWENLDTALETYRSNNIDPTVYIMPVGGSIEGQMGQIEGHMAAGDIADEALARGYHVSARVHNYLWANAIGK